MANAARFTGLAGLAGLFGLAAAAVVSGAGDPSVGALPVFVLVSLSLVVGLATAASP
jgi:hypothetical protein